MRKGIIKTILIFTLVQLIGFILSFFILILLLNFLFKSSEQNIRSLIVGLILILSSLSGLILLGFHLNKKYKNSASYGGYFFVGSCVSIISNGILVLALFIISNILITKHPLNSVDSFYAFLGFCLFNIFECLLIGIFYKKFKIKRKFFNIDNNDSLDSDIVNNEK